MATEVKASPSWWSLTAVVLCIGIIAWLAFTATSKEDSQNYTKGAVHNESTTNFSPTQNIYPLGFAGCAPFLRADNPLGKSIPLPAPEAKQVKGKK